jgi:C-terminal processing protease CtpA/Prc
MSFWTGLDPLTASTATGARILGLAKGLERDSEQGLRLSKTPFSFSLREILPPAPGGAVWKKPVLVLIDELCGSGGDSFPMLMKANGLGKLFGNRTAGLGGSVEKVIDLPFTRSSLSVTRGLFTTFKPNGQYSDSDYVENNGVTPDVSYTHTVKDFREGFETYFKAFSDEATK